MSIIVDTLLEEKHRLEEPYREAARKLSDLRSNNPELNETCIIDGQPVNALSCRKMDLMTQALLPEMIKTCNALWRKYTIFWEFINDYLPPESRIKFEPAITRENETVPCDEVISQDKYALLIANKKTVEVSPDYELDVDSYRAMYKRWLKELLIALLTREEIDNAGSIDNAISWAVKSYYEQYILPYYQTDKKEVEKPKMFYKSKIN